MNSYRETLKTTFETRRNKNPAYSLRAFAGDLRIGVSTLSEILSKKKRLARKTAVKILPRLGIGKRDQELFLLSVDYENPSFAQTKLQISQKIESHRLVGKVITTENAHHDLAANPQYATLLALLGVANFRYHLPWISGLLGTFQHETTRLFQRLKDMGAIKFNSGGEPEMVKNFILTPDGTKIESIRAYHRITLQRALHAIENTPREERDFCATVLAIDEKDYEEIQKDVREFHRKIFTKYGDRENASRVYSLQNQFIPLSARNELGK